MAFDIRIGAPAAVQEIITNSTKGASLFLTSRNKPDQSCEACRPVHQQAIASART